MFFLKDSLPKMNRWYMMLTKGFFYYISIFFYIFFNIKIIARLMFLYPSLRKKTTCTCDSNMKVQ